MPKYYILTFGAKVQGVSALGPIATFVRKPILMQMLRSNTHETLRSIVFALLAIYWLFYAPKIDPLSRSRPRFGHPRGY